MNAKSRLLGFFHFLLAIVALALTAASGWGLVYVVDLIGDGSFGFWLGSLLFCGAAVALGILILSLLFWVPLGRHRPIEWELSEDERARLEAIIFETAAKLEVSPPRRIASNSDINAYASFHGGLPGLLRNEAKLSVGGPLLIGLPDAFLRPIIAHELGHLRDGAAMRAIAFSFEVEGGLKRMTGFASLSIRRWHLRNQRLTVFSIVGLAYFSLCEEVVSAIIAPVWIPAKRLFRKVEVEMEYRADDAAAELCGANAVIDAMKALGALGVAIGEEEVGRDGLEIKRRAVRFHDNLRKGNWRRMRFPEGSLLERRLARLAGSMSASTPPRF